MYICTLEMYMHIERQVQHVKYTYVLISARVNVYKASCACVAHGIPYSVLRCCVVHLHEHTHIHDTRNVHVHAHLTCTRLVKYRGLWAALNETTSINSTLQH